MHHLHACRATFGRVSARFEVFSGFPVALPQSAMFGGKDCNPEKWSCHPALRANRHGSENIPENLSVLNCLDMCPRQLSSQETRFGYRLRELPWPHSEHPGAVVRK